MLRQNPLGPSFFFRLIGLDYSLCIFESGLNKLSLLPGFSRTSVLPKFYCNAFFKCLFEFKIKIKI